MEKKIRMYHFRDAAPLFPNPREGSKIIDAGNSFGHGRRMLFIKALEERPKGFQSF